VNCAGAALPPRLIVDTSLGSIQYRRGALIISVRRRLQDIALIAEDQLYCIRALIPVDSGAFPIGKQRDYLQDAARGYETALRVLQRYETQASELHQQYLASLQAKTDSRIRILTILSAICMPLTLIAGIYGMNFARMPELRASWGYPATLAAMFLIAVGQLWFFYKRGWLG
jgi:magnesium transporter